MAKTWVLDTETKGTGANMVPLEKVLKRPEAPEKPLPRPKRPVESDSAAAAEPRRAGAPRRPTPKPKPQPERTATPLPPGHVRKKATGELGKVQAVDSRAGTATVRWLKGGATSTVPLSAISRR
ncbi:MAG: hypothetical protein QOI45_2668 [Thermoleophilaceae bacterium]|nr:hypothetical protein [Thermoleophilaceae bacterium]